jgi:hypothetical protein
MKADNEIRDGSLSLARELTEAASRTKEWRMRGIHARRMAAVARELAEGAGYILATGEEMTQRYGDLFVPGRTDGKAVWCVYQGFPDRNGRVDLSFVAV